MEKSASKSRPSKKGKKEEPVRTEKSLKDAVDKSDQNSISLNQQIAKSKNDLSKEKEMPTKGKNEREAVVSKSKIEEPVVSVQEPANPMHGIDINSMTKVNSLSCKHHLTIFWVSKIFPSNASDRMRCLGVLWKNSISAA